MILKDAVELARVRKYFHELWKYRELFLFFVWRDYTLRYRETFVGIGWAVFQPIATALVFTIIFTKAGFGIGTMPYFVFVFMNLALWFLFANSITEATHSLVRNQSVLGKVYFPRVFIPTSACAIQYVDFVVSTLVLGGVSIYLGFIPSVSIIVSYIFASIILFLCALGIGYVLAATVLRFRDVRFILPYFIQLLLFITPVFYSAGTSASWPFSRYNPLWYIFSDVHQTIVMGAAPAARMALMLCLGALVCAAGALYYRKKERDIIDSI
jgi:lipopolysaccharide transport system permease protein